ncbi:MAG TPA: cellulose binding domain-containing protein [Actinocrinis sp.]|uniref:cellulose binding domain-containing protein n=1 Tax=Actinocrinis sp. TaxID=1920516 RepID=UPI002DDD9095|nr:cellulose binding domain-containing protein [Actinocrinis sp.]HEV2345382.1 cellulose binding domain-containing protein [Actinocrinis sp.]
MRRILGIATTLLLAVPIFGGTAAAAVGGTSAAAASCTGTIDITQISMTPASVTPGQGATMNFTAVNCTSQSVTTNLIEYGRFLGPGSSTGVPQGCPVIDPIAPSVTFAPNGTYTGTIGFQVFSGCTATSLEGIINFENSSGVNVQGTATVAIVQPVPPIACHVTYTTQSQWQGGFTAAVSISNTGVVADNGWTLTFTFGGDQKITGVWGAAATQSGEMVTLTNLSYDATITPGATVSGIGFQGTWSASDAAASSFAVNGTICS